MTILAVASNQLTVSCVLRLSRSASKICQLWGFSLITCWNSSNNPACTAQATFRMGKSRGKGKGKGTAVLIHTLKAYASRGSRGMALLIFNHGTSRR